MRVQIATGASSPDPIQRVKYLRDRRNNRLVDHRASTPANFRIMLDLAVDDLDCDDDLDLAATSDFYSSNSPGNVAILLNNGDGTFPPDVLYWAGGFPYAIVTGDLDGDNDSDIAVSDVNDLGNQLVRVLENLP